jgi:hypothetical protein
MIKYFYELSESEFEEIAKSEITWEQCAKDYPQPLWCEYPDAVCGQMGCWSLMYFNIHSKEDCYACEFFKP